MKTVKNIMMKINSVRMFIAALSLAAIFIILVSSCTKETAIVQPSVPLQSVNGLDDLKTLYTALHCLALNPGSMVGTRFVYVLPSNYLTDTTSSRSAKSLLIAQMIYMNQEANHGAPHDLINHPYDTIFYGVQGNKIAEMWVGQTQLQINAGSPYWIERILDKGYAPHDKIMTNPRAFFKIIYPNL